MATKFSRIELLELHSRAKARRLLRLTCTCIALALAQRDVFAADGKGSTEDWIESLRSPAVGVKIESAYDFSRLSRASVPTLVHYFSDSDPFVRRSIVAALGEIEPESTKVIPRLIEALEDQDEGVREQATVSLGKSGAAAVPALIAILQRGMQILTPEEQRNLMTHYEQCGGYYVHIPAFEAAMALSQIGVASVPALIESLRLPPRPRIAPDSLSASTNLKTRKSPDVNTYAYTYLSLRRIGIAAVPLLTRALQEDLDPSLRLRVALAVAWIREDLKQAGAARPGEVNHAADLSAPILAAAANNPKSFLRFEAIKALGWVGPKGAPFLASMLNDKKVIAAVLASLAEQGTAATSAAPTLINLLHQLESRWHHKAKSRKLTAIRDEEIQEIWQIQEILDKIAPKEAVQSRIRQLGAGSLEDERIISELGALGPDARHELVSLLGTDLYAVKAAQALLSSGTDTSLAVNSLVKALRTQEGSLAAAALGRFGPQALQAIPALISAMELPDIRPDAIRALGSIGPRSPQVIPALIGALQIGSTDDRRTAAEALGQIGPPAETAVPHLIAALQDPEDAIRYAALDAIGGIGPAASPAVPALVQIAQRKNDHCRTAALFALAKIRLGAKAAAPDLEELLYDTDPHIRRFSALALANVSPESQVEIPILVADLHNWTRSDSQIALAEIGAPAIPALIEAARTTGGQRLPALRVLASLGPTASAAKPHLLVLLHDPDPDVRIAAIDTLVAVGIDPREGGRALLATITDLALHDFTVDGLREILRMWHGEIWCLTGPTTNHLPRFPWPPPHSSAHDVLPRSPLGSDSQKLSAVYSRLRSALLSTGFEESGLFEVPGGFALVTRVERILDDGTSSPASRWTSGKGRPLGLIDYLGRLFLERPGQFRLIVFLVTDQDDWEMNSKTLSERELRELSLAGGRILPDSIGTLPWRGHNCHALIFHFERSQEGTILLYPSPLSTREHLRKAGLWEQLALSSSAKLEQKP